MSTPVEETSKNRFIDPKVLVKIQNLELVARTVVEGFVSGLHRSPFLGFSVDFAEYRDYQPGDDLRRIDWNVYSRMDKLVIKLFEGETNTKTSDPAGCERIDELRLLGNHERSITAVCSPPVWLILPITSATAWVC